MRWHASSITTVFVRLSISLACCGRNDLGQPRPKDPLLISDLSFLNPIGFVWQSYLYLGVCLSVIFVCSIQNPVLMYCTITRRYWYIPSLHWGSATKALCCVRLFNEGAETCHASQSTVEILGKFVKGFSKQHEFDSPNQWTFTRKWHGHWDRLLLLAILTCFFQGHPGLTYRHHCRHAALWRHQCVASGHAIPAAAQKQSQRHSADSASGILGSIFPQRWGN